MNITLLVTHVAEWLGVIAIAWFISRVPRLRAAPVGFKYPRREGLIALALGASAVLFAFIFTTPQLAGLAPRLIPLPEPSAALARPLFVALVTLLPVIAALATRGQPPRSAGWGRQFLRVGLQSGLTAVLLTILLRNRAMDLISGIDSGQATYLLAAVGIALAEETVFRGYIQARLGWWMGQNRGWLVTGLFYAAFRFPLLLAAGDLNAALFGLVIALGQGLVAGWLMRQSGHVLAPALYRAASIWLNVFI